MTDDGGISALEKTIRRIVYFFAALAAAAMLVWMSLELFAATGYPLLNLPRAAKQPVEYSHKKHLALGMECAACHTGALEGTHAGIPPTAFCASCHRPGASDTAAAPVTPEMKPFIEGREEIPWVQFQRAPRHVYFSHRRHVSMGKIDCESCHGNMKEQSSPVTDAVFPRNLSGMNRCVDCHKRENVSTDCMACHR